MKDFYGFKSPKTSARLPEKEQIKGIQPVGQVMCSNIQHVFGVSSSPGSQLYLIRGAVGIQAFTRHQLQIERERERVKDVTSDRLSLKERGERTQQNKPSTA